MKPLEISNLSVSYNNQHIIKHVNLTIERGKISALMGPNGSGKTTLSYALMGHPIYKITSGTVNIDNKNILSLSPSERAKSGLFLGFQKPVSIPGISVTNFLRSSYVAQFCKTRKNNCMKCSVRDFISLLTDRAKQYNIDPKFLEREVNEGFSGGESKKFEILQMAVLSPKFAILDEIDAGLDIDALKIVTQGIKKLVENNLGALIITHNPKVFHYLKPDCVYILVKGSIVSSGDEKLILKIEKEGYLPYD